MAIIARYVAVQRIHAIINHQSQQKVCQSDGGDWKASDGAVGLYNAGMQHGITLSKCCKNLRGKKESKKLRHQKCGLLFGGCCRVQKDVGPRDPSPQSVP
ncbi:hypothetical protein ACOSQ2_026002 [Xanthoceras sorbifolium]